MKYCWAGMCGMMRSTAAVLHSFWVNKARTVNVGVCPYSVCISVVRHRLCTSLSVCLTVGGYVLMHISMCLPLHKCGSEFYKNKKI